MTTIDFVTLYIVQAKTKRPISNKHRIFSQPNIDFLFQCRALERVDLFLLNLQLKTLMNETDSFLFLFNLCGVQFGFRQASIILSIYLVQFGFKQASIILSI